jgi:hypothetical protein
MVASPARSESASQPPLVNVAEVRRALLALAQPGQVTELRVLSARTTTSPHYTYQASGYFNDPILLIKNLANLRSARGVYITLHPCKPALLARANNRLRTPDEMRKAPATSDQHIIRLQWLPIDIDPERPADISSTEEEHQAALSQAQVVKRELRALGWPDPLEADSGNGAHLLYRVDLPITEGIRETGLLHRVLKGLAARFDLIEKQTGEGLVNLHIDQSVSNSSRIWKLYGTLACKGDHMPERPHRLARLLAVPEHIETVSVELLAALAAPLPGVPVVPLLSQHRFDLARWIEQHQLDVSGPVAWDGGQKWVFRVCPWNADHTQGGAFLGQRVNGAVVAGCLHASCRDKGWRDLRALYEPGSGNVGAARGGKRNPVNATCEADVALLEQALSDHNLTMVMAAIPALAQLSRPLYMQQRLRIKAALGKEINLNQLDAAVAEAQQRMRGKGDRESQVELLVALAEQQAIFFVDPGGMCYARFPVHGHMETHPIHERGGLFKLWLLTRYREAYRGIPNDPALTTAIQALTATALLGKAEPQSVCVRVGWHDGCIYLDLADRAYQVVEISAYGWRVLPGAPVYFRRYNGMKELPVPASGGTLDMLDPFLNADEEGRLLAKAWLLGCLHPHGPYPALGLHGERGAAKTTTARVLRSLIDPCVALLRSAPKDIQALAVAAMNNHILGLDNLSMMPGWLSDALCRTATGAGDAYRQLYTDSDEVVFNYTRPIIFTGIEEIGTRGDFLDRCLLLHLPALSDTMRRTEKDFWSAFEAVHPLLLGALLDAVCQALQNYDQVVLPEKPRMADFATWITACEKAILSKDQAPGTFLTVYLANREEAVGLEIEASSVGSALKRFMDSLAQNEWRGTARELLETLNEREMEQIRRTRSWPADARALSSRLKRLATSLRTMGVAIQWRRVQGERIMILRKADMHEASS